MKTWTSLNQREQFAHFQFEQHQIGGAPPWWSFDSLGKGAAWTLRLVTRRRRVVWKPPVPVREGAFGQPTSGSRDALPFLGARGLATHSPGLDPTCSWPPTASFGCVQEDMWRKMTTPFTKRVNASPPHVYASPPQNPHVRWLVVSATSPHPVCWPLRAPKASARQH